MSTSVNLSQLQKDHSDFVESVRKMSGQDVRRCYQCGKCSAGCPVHNCGGMDVSPNRIMRMVQLGMEEEVLKTKTIWVCVQCSTCTARCPRDIDVARVMDGLRIIGKKKNMVQYAKNATDFHNIFMNSITRYGRVYEFGLAVALTLKNGYILSQMDIGPATMLKGNLDLLPPRMKNSGQIKKVIANIKRMEGEK